MEWRHQLIIAKMGDKNDSLSAYLKCAMEVFFALRCYQTPKILPGEQRESQEFYEVLAQIAIALYSNLFQFALAFFAAKSQPQIGHGDLPAPAPQMIRHHSQTLTQ